MLERFWAASLGGSAGCGAAGEVISIVDNGDGTCSALYQLSNGTKPNTCLTSFFNASCDAFAGSIEIYITYPAGTTPATYKQPAIQTWLTNLGVGNITVLGQLLTVFVDHSNDGTLPLLAPQFLTSLRQAGSVYVRECANCINGPPSGVPSTSSLIALPGLTNIYQLVWQGTSIKSSTAVQAATSAATAAAVAAVQTGSAMGVVLPTGSVSNPAVRAGAGLPTGMQAGRPILGTTVAAVASPAGSTMLKRGSRKLLALQDYVSNLGAGLETLSISYTAFPDMSSFKGLVCPPKYINLTNNKNLTTMDGLNQLATSSTGTILNANGSGPFATAGAVQALNVLGNCYGTPSTAAVLIPIGCNQVLSTWQSVCTYQGSPAW